MYRIFNKLKIFSFLIAISVAFTRVSYAAFTCPVTTNPYPTLDQLSCPIERGLEVLIYSSGAVFLGIVFYSAIKYSLSQGDPKALQGSQQTLTWGVIGFLIIVFVVSLANIIAAIFGASLSTTIQGAIQSLLTWIADNQHLP